MSPRFPFFGYGLTPVARAADRAALAADLPARGPGCPFTVDLIELALGLAPPEESARLREHVGGCTYCLARYEAQQRAAQHLPARPPRPAAAPATPVAELFL